MTSVCPQCQRGMLIMLRSQFRKICSSCDHIEAWDLKPGQKPLIAGNRDTRGTYPK